MHYRWIRYRYAEVVSEIGPQALGDPWGTRPPVTLARSHWHPPVDLYETAGELIVKIEIAGLSEEDLDVIIYNDALVVEGVRSWKISTDVIRFHAVEVRYGPFRVALPLLTAIDQERVRAEYDLGFLIVTLAKMEARIP
jgi:HSP20 family protein